MISEPKISIIVPVYNVEQYLSKCLDSLIQQTYTNIEIICINDESPDNSLGILEQYAQKDKRIKIINQKNTGLSGARNKGIEAATGDYITFVDSDDWIDLDTCEVALKSALEYDADVVLWSYIREFSNYSRIKKIFNNDIIIFSYMEVKQKLHRRFCGLSNEELNHPDTSDAIATAWAKLYKSKLIKKNEIQFIDTKLIGTEDALFNFNLFNYVSKAVFINKYFNHYRKDNETSLTTKYKSNLYEQWQYLFDLMEKNIDDNELDETYKKALNNRIGLSIIGLGLNELSNDTSALAQINAIKKIISSDRYKIAYKELPLTYFPMHWKVFFLFAKYGFATGVYMLLVIINKMIGR